MIIGKTRTNQPVTADEEGLATAVNQGIESGDIEVPTLDVGDVINLGQLSVTEIGEGAYEAQFYKELTRDEMSAIPSNGLAIIMFNTTCVIIPYTKSTFNRFVCNAIFDNSGNTMVARAKMNFYDGIEGTPFIMITFDTNFSYYANSMNKPYGIIRFIGL